MRSTAITLVSGVLCIGMPGLLSLPIFPLVTDFLDVIDSLTLLLRVSASIRSQVDLVAVHTLLGYLVAKKPLYIVDEQWIESCNCHSIKELENIIHRHLRILDPDIYARNPRLLYVTLKNYSYCNGIVWMALDTLSSILVKSVDENFEISHAHLIARLTSEKLFPSAIIDCVLQYGFNELFRWEKVTAIFSLLLRPEISDHVAHSLMYASCILELIIPVKQCYNYFKTALFGEEAVSHFSNVNRDHAIRCMINAIKGLSNFLCCELLKGYSFEPVDRDSSYVDSIDLLRSVVLDSSIELHSLTSDLIISLVTFISNMYKSNQNLAATMKLLSAIPLILSRYLDASCACGCSDKARICIALVRLFVRIGAFESYIIGDVFTISERSQMYSQLLLLDGAIEPSDMLETLRRIFFR